MAHHEHIRDAVVGVRIELQQAAKILRGTVEAADEDVLLIRWDSGGVTTLRNEGAESHVIGHYGVSAFEVAPE
jgi:hypothetical protein